MNWLNLEEIKSWIQSPGRAHESPKGFPMFQTKDVQNIQKSAADLPGHGTILLANNMDTVWFIETKERKTPLANTDCQQFLKLKILLQEQYPEKYVRGILLTSAPVKANDKATMDEEDCYLIQVTES